MKEAWLRTDEAEDVADSIRQALRTAHAIPDDGRQK